MIFKAQKLRQTQRSPYLVIAAVLPVILVALLFTTSVAADTIPSSFAQVKAQHRASMTAVLDRGGQPIAHVRTNKQVLQAEWSGLADFSPALLSMVLRSEDQDFVQHWGVDFTALLAA